MGRILKLINKTANPTIEERKTSAVFFDDTKKVLDLRQKPPIFEFHFDPLKNFLAEHKKNVLIIVSFVLCFAILASFFRTYASVATFYPKTCLGGWENPELATGEPTLKQGADPAEFNHQNSAYTKDKVTTLYCGEFSGEIPTDTTPNHFKLSFSWSVDNGSVQHVESGPIEQSAPKNSAGNVIDTPTTPDVTPTPTTETVPEPAPAVESAPSDSAPTSFLQKTFGDLFLAKAFAQDSSSVEVIDSGESSAAISVPSTPAEPQQTPTATPPSDTETKTEESVTLPASTLDDKSTPLVPAADSIPTPEAIAPVDTSSVVDTSNPDKAEGFLEVLYTLDGTHWKSLGLVNQSDWRHVSFNIPLSSWEDLTHFQVAVKTISSFDTSPAIYIDSMSLDVEYGPIEKVNVLPTVVLKDSSDVISGSDNFASTDDVSFVVVDPGLSATDFASLVQQGSADVVSDPSGVIEQRTALDGIISPPAKNPSDAISDLLDSAKNVVIQTESVAPTGTGVIDSSLKVSDTPITPPKPILPPADATGSFNAEDNTLSAPMMAPSGESTDKKTETPQKPVSFFNIARPLTAYAADEAPAPTVEAQVLDFEGKETDIPVTITTEYVGGKEKNNIKIKKPARDFRPGKYTLHVKMKTDDAIIITEQDFTWGVLAVNVDRSIYRSGDDAYIQFGVLTDDGNTVCNADIDLTIKNPVGASVHFSTDDHTIVQEKKCGRNNIIDVPDYYAHYKIPPVTGTYQMVVTARTINGARTVNDHFDVVPAVSFDVVRTAPTRINPLSAYPVTLAITPTANWTGTIVEKVPANFIISHPAHSLAYDSTDTVADTQYLFWNVSLVAGKETLLGYKFDAPDISPEFYIEGPLEFYDPGMTPNVDTPIFKEVRSWQIASDANCASPGGSTTGTWTGITWSCGHTPTTSDNVTITATDVITMNANSASLGTLTVNGTLDTSTSNYSVTATSLTIGSAGVMTANASSITLNGTGTPLTMTSGGTFNAGTSTVTESPGNNSITLSGGTGSFTGSNALYNFTGTSSGFNLTMGADLTVTNLFQTTNQTVSTSGSNYALKVGYASINGLALQLNASTFTVTGTSAYPGALTALITTPGGLTAGTSTIVITGDDTLKVFNNSPTINNITFQPVLSNNRTYTLGTPTYNGNFTVNPTTSSSPTTHTLTLSGAVTLGATKTMTVQGDTYSTTALGSNYSVGFLSIASGGILSPGSTQFSLTGTTGTAMTNSGSFVAGTSKVFAGSAPTLNSGSWTGSNALYDFYVQVPGSTVTLGANIEVTHVTDLLSAFDTSTSNYSFTSAYIRAASGAATINFRSSTITLTGTGSNPGTCSGNVSLLCGSGTWSTSSSNWVVNGDGAITVFQPALTINDLTFSPSISANRAYTMGTMPTGINGDFTINPSGSANTLTYTLAGNLATIGATKTITIKATGGSATGKLDTSGTNYTLSAGKFVLDNGGTLVSNSSAITVSGTSGTLWTQNTGSSMTGSGSTVTFSGAANSSQTMTSGTAVSFSGNVTINNASFAAPLGASTTFGNTLTITAGTLDTNNTGNYSLTGPNLVIASGATLTARASTLTFSGNTRPFDNTSGSTFTAGTSTVIITSTSGTVTYNRSAITFYNFTINSTATKIQLAATTSIAAGGKFYIQQGTFDDLQTPVVGTSTSTWQMDSGTRYRAGSTFPSAFTNANMSFNSNSTIEYYYAGAAYNISGTPTYGNLQILPDLGANGPASTLTVTGNLDVIGTAGYFQLNGTLNVTGTITLNDASGGVLYTNGTAPCPANGCDITSGGLTITAGTLRMWNGNSLTVSGNVSITGTLNMWGSSTMSVSGNWTNNGTYTTGTSSTTFTTTSSATIGGSVSSTFYNLTQNGVGGTVTLNTAMTVSNNMTLTNGTFDDGAKQITGNVTGTLSAASGTTLKLGGSGTATTFPTNFTTGHCSLNSASTVIYNATVAQTISGTPAYGNLQLSTASGTPTKSLGAAVTINGSLTVDANNTFDVTVSNFAVGLGGNFTNNGTFTARNGTVTLSGTVTQTLTGNFTSGTSSSFYNLTITNVSGADPSGAEVTGMTASVAYASPITSSNNYTITPTCTTNCSRIQYNSGSTYTFNNINWVGASGHKIFFRNSATSGTWLLKVTGTQTAIQYVDVSRSDASVSGGSTITATGTGNVDSGNNTNWVFVSATISGNAYNDGGTSTVWTKCNGSTANISLVVNGATALTTTCNAGTGAYSFSSVGISSNQPISVFFNTAGSNTDQGVVVTKTASSPSATITGLNPHKGYVWVQEETSAASITNTNLDHCDSASPASCANVPYTVTTGALTAASGFELRLASTATYAPGGDVTASLINIAGTYTAGTETLTLTGTGTTTLFTRTGTFTQTNGTVKVTSATGTPTLLSGATTFHILHINAAATVVNGGSAITIEDTSGAKLYVQSGVLNDSGLGIATSGSTTNTLQLDSGGVLCLGGASGANTSATCDTSATSTTARAFPSFFTNTLDPASTVIYLSDAATTVSQAVTYGNLKLMPVLTAARTYTNGSGVMTIAGNYDINPNSAGANLLTVNAAGAISVGTTKTITITRQGSSATSSLAIHPGVPQYNLSAAFINIGAGGKLDCRNTSYTGTITVGGTSGTLFTNNGTFTQGNSTVTIGSTSGTPTFLSGATTFHIVKVNASGATVINQGSALTLDNTAGNALWIAAGTFNVEGNAFTAGLTGTLQMDGNTKLCLGGTTGATNATCDSGATQTSAVAMPAFTTFTSAGTPGSLDPTSTVAYLANADITIASAPNYGTLRFTPVLTAGHIYTGGGALSIGGGFGIVPSSAGANLLTVNAGGDITVPATQATTISRSGSATSTLFLRVGGTDYNLSTGFLTVAAGGTLDQANTVGSTVTISGTSGTLFTLGGTYTITSGTPTVNFSGNGSATLNSATMTFYTLTSSGTGTKTIAGGTVLTITNLNVNAGTFDPNSTTVATPFTPTSLLVQNGTTLLVDATTWNGNYNGFVTRTLQSTSTVDYKRNGNQTIDALAYGNLTTSGSSGTKTLSNGTAASNNVTLNGSATLDTDSVNNWPLNAAQIIFSGGTLNGNASTIGVSGTTGTPVTYSSGVFNAGTSTFMYSGDNLSGNTTVESALTYYTLLVSNSTETYVLNGNTTLGSGGTLYVSDGTLDTTGSNWTISAGYLNIGNTSTAIFKANASSLTFAGTSGTILTRGSAGTFNGGTSIVTLSGNGTATLNSDTFVGTNKFDTLISSGTGTKTLGGAIEATTSLQETGGTLDTGASYGLTLGKITIGASGSLTANGSFIFLQGTSGTLFTLASGGTFSSGLSTVYVNPDASVTVTSGTFTGSNAFNVLTLNPHLSSTGRTYTFGGGAIKTNGDFTIQPTAGSALALTVNLGAAFTVAANKTTNVSCSGSATSTLSTLGFSLTTGTLTIDNFGTLTAGSSTITLNSTSGGVLFILNPSGTFNANTSTVVAQSDVNLPIENGAFTGSNAFYSLTLSPTITAARNYVLSSTAIDINGDFTINPTASSAFNLLVSLGGTTTVNASHTTLVTASSSAHSELDTTSLGNYAFSTGTLTIGSAGTFDGNASSVGIAGDWTNNGTFNQGTSTVTFNTGTTAQVNGSTTFYNLTLTHSSAKEVDFAASGGTPTFSVQNAFTVTGHSGQLIKIRSASAGTQFDFLPASTATVDYADVKDGGCHSGSITMAPTNSVDSGNNAYCWGFAQLMTFDIDTSISGSASSPPYAVPFGVLSAAAVKDSDTSSINMIVLNGATSAPNGMTITVQNLAGNAGLRSTSVPTDTIPSATATMSAGTANYGLCVDSGTIAGFNRSAGYITTCSLGSGSNNVVGLTTTPASIVETAAPLASGIAKVVVNAAVSTATPAHTDYSDTLTFIATGSF